jgi:hypothetical protein
MRAVLEEIIWRNHWGDMWDDYGLIETASCQIKKTVTGESQKNQKPSAIESENVASPEVARRQV